MERDEEKADDYTDYYGGIGAGITDGGSQMDQVQKLTEELLAEMKECKEYLRYQDAKRALDKYPVLKEQVNSFLKQNYEISAGSKNLFEDGERLRQKFAYLIEQPFAWEYLMAENAMCRVLRQVNWRLLEGLKFEIDFL